MAFEQQIQVLVEAEKNRQAVGPISDLVPRSVRSQSAPGLVDRLP